MTDDLRAIAEQLLRQSNDATWWHPSPTPTVHMLERAMRLRDEAWSSEVKRIAHWDRVEIRLPTAEQLNARMSELLKAEARK